MSTLHDPDPEFEGRVSALLLGVLIRAGIIMAFGEGGARAIRSIFERVADGKRGAEFADPSTATIRAVAKGVLGVAFLQAIIVGTCMLIAGIPWAGFRAQAGDAEADADAPARNCHNLGAGPYALRPE